MLYTIPKQHRFFHARRWNYCTTAALHAVSCSPSLHHPLLSLTLRLVRELDRPLVFALLGELLRKAEHLLRVPPLETERRRGLARRFPCFVCRLERLCLVGLRGAGGPAGSTRNEGCRHRRGQKAPPSARCPSCPRPPLLSSAGSVERDPVAHIGVEVLQVAVLPALRLERGGPDLAVAAPVAPVQGADPAPFLAVHREMAHLADGGAEELARRFMPVAMTWHDAQEKFNCPAWCNRTACLPRRRRAREDRRRGCSRR